MKRVEQFGTRLRIDCAPDVRTAFVDVDLDERTVSLDTEQARTLMNQLHDRLTLADDFHAAEARRSEAAGD